MTVSIAVLAGGVGGSRFVLGVREAARRRWPSADGAGTTASITVIANTGDDLWLSGVRLQPDFDSLLYALAGVNDVERGWGRTGETERVAAELAAYGSGWPWFTLGDLDLGTHLARTGWLREGVPLAEADARIAARWPLGVRLLPMTEAEVDTRVVVAAEALPDAPSAPGNRSGSQVSGGIQAQIAAGGAAPENGAGEVRMHFQEWWVRHRATVPALRFENPGIEAAVPAPGVLEAIAAADAVLVAPSNPVVSIGPILAVPGIAEAVRNAPGGVVGVSPIIGGAVVRGMADACLAAIGVPTAADAVGRRYGARPAAAPGSSGASVDTPHADGSGPQVTAGGGGPLGAFDRAGAPGLLDAWLIAEEDAALAPGIEAAGLRTVVAPLWMRDPDSSAALASAALDAALAAR